MKKILFFHIPSFGAYNSIHPLLTELCKRDYKIIHYNAGSFRDKINHKFIEFVEYDNYQGYYPERVKKEMNLFEYGLLLLETSKNVMQFAEKEIRKENPDLVLHSKYASWGKLGALKFNVPAICLTTSFVFSPQLVFNKENDNTDFGKVIIGKKFLKESIKFYTGYGINNLDINDIFINKEKLNLVFGLKEFQPNAELLGPEFKFVGHLMEIPEYKKKLDLIYISLGSIFIGNLNVIDICLKAFSKINRQVVISVGDKINISDLGEIPSNIKVYKFVDQVELLKSTSLFITHGGGNSVYEAIYYNTPMIVIPQIYEHLLIAKKIEELGIGLYMDEEGLNPEMLEKGINSVFDNSGYYITNLQKIKNLIPKSSLRLSVELIEKYLKEEY